MSNRKHFDHQFGEAFVIECDGLKYPFVDCFKYAEIASMAADIHDSVLKTLDKKYIRLVVVSAEPDYSTNGIHKGWYCAYSISATDAARTRKSWAVLREQPGEPTGPWAG